MNTMYTMNDTMNNTTNTITVTHQDENNNTFVHKETRAKGSVKVKMNKEGRVKMVMDTQHFVTLTALLYRVRLGAKTCNTKNVLDLVTEIEKFLPQYDLDHLVDDASDSIIVVTEDGSATIYDPVFEFNDYE